LPFQSTTQTELRAAVVVAVAVSAGSLIRGARVVQPQEQAVAAVEVLAAVLEVLLAQTLGAPVHHNRAPQERLQQTEPGALAALMQALAGLAVLSGQLAQLGAMGITMGRVLRAARLVGRLLEMETFHGLHLGHVTEVFRNEHYIQNCCC
jgi:hypothetical protein